MFPCFEICFIHSSKLQKVSRMKHESQTILARFWELPASTCSRIRCFASISQCIMFCSLPEMKTVLNAVLKVYLRRTATKRRSNSSEDSRNRETNGAERLTAKYGCVLVGISAPYRFVICSNSARTVCIFLFPQ